MIKAVVFDMFETLVTLFKGRTYFSENIAEDLGIPVDAFRDAWHKTELDRTIGMYTLEDGLRKSLEMLDACTDEAVELVVRKRREGLTDTFNNIPDEIINLLTELKKRGILIGVISNCFSDECEMIHNSKLFPFFDSAKLSYEQGTFKPNPVIFYRMLDELGLEPNECLYVGDGGSRELLAATAIGMKAVQAEWFRPLAFEPHIPCPVMMEYDQAEKPADVLLYLN
ncbi:MAG: HAD family hydrolase [Lachnospiraceae bacterium]|nr:HAD family hydrolase [Lachnospiraceae bacterium]